MNKLIIILIFLTSIVLAQKRWGQSVKWYDQTYGDDDNQVRIIATQIDSVDTVYSQILDASWEDDEGIWNIVFRADSVDASSDSVFLDVRRFRKAMPTGKKWSDWINLFPSVKTDTTYELIIAPNDCTWAKPCNAIQYRCIRQDVTNDTLIPYLGDYRR